MRVLLVDLSRDWRGGQEQALLLLKGLRSRGHGAELVALHGAPLAARAAAEEIPVHTVPYKSRRIGTMRLVSRLVRRHKFDVVHANEPHAVFASFFALAQRHAAFVIARRVVIPVPRDWFHLIRYRAAARIIAVSQAVQKDLLSAKLDPPGVDVIADGVELQQAISAEEGRRARERWGIADGERVLSFAASFSNEKGHALLLDAFNMVRQKVPGVRLLLAGEGPLRREMEERVRDAGLDRAVIFAGFVDDVRAVHAASDVFVFPALFEGAGSALLGAMAAGVPAVALAKGGVPEIIDNERNGLLVREAEPVSLASALLRLLSDQELARKLALAGRETVAAHFSADRMTDETVGAFERLIRRRSLIRDAPLQASERQRAPRE